MLFKANFTTAEINYALRPTRLFIDTRSVSLVAVGVFEEEFVGAQRAFLEAVSDVKTGHDVRVGYSLLANVVTTPHDDSFTAAKKGIRIRMYFD